jgi:DNA-binding response OmpR family regulator
VASFLAIAGEERSGPDVLEAFNTRDVVGACIGPVCSAAARSVGITEPATPEVGRLGLLVRVLADALAHRRQQVVIRGEPFVVQGRSVVVDGRPVDVPERERVVLAALLERRGAVVSRTTFLRAFGAEETTDRALEATVARLRRRLGPAGAAIRTVRGRGYLLDAERSS